MGKLNRVYNLIVQKQDNKLLKVARPFTVEFDIHRNSFSSANVGSFRIYNLAPENRRQILKNQVDVDDYRTVSFSAGYGEKQSLAFAGNVTQAWSVREGVDMITQIECFDGGFEYVNAIIGKTYPSGTTQTAIIDDLVKAMPTVSRGAIGAFPGQITRANSLNGSTTEALSDITGGGFFIDNGKAHCLNDNECLDTAIPIINAASGLLNTPVREQNFITIDMLFEPGIIIAQKIRLESETADIFNGEYKVISIKHRGIISESVSGTAITTLGLLPGSFETVRVGG